MEWVARESNSEPSSLYLCGGEEGTGFFGINLRHRLGRPRGWLETSAHETVSFRDPPSVSHVNPCRVRDRQLSSWYYARGHLVTGYLDAIAARHQCKLTIVTNRRDFPYIQ